MSRSIFLASFFLFLASLSPASFLLPQAKVNAQILNQDISNSNSNSNSNSIPQKHALIVSIPLTGHLNPLLALAEELLDRGWTITVASNSEIKKHVVSQLPFPVSVISSLSSFSLSHFRFLDLGSVVDYCNEDNFSVYPHTTLEEAVKAATEETNYAVGAGHMFNWTSSIQPCLYAGFVKASSSSSSSSTSSIPVSLVIGDFATSVVFDICSLLSVPCVLNNADLLGMISPVSLPAVDYVPAIFSGDSLHSLRGDAPYSANLPRRLLYTLGRALFFLHASLVLTPTMNLNRASVGLPPLPSMYALTRTHTILVNAAFPLEYPRPVPPLVHMVGSMVPASKLNEDGKLWARELSLEELKFLDGDKSAELRDVMYVSMGTLAPLSLHQVKTLVDAFTVLESSVRVLWKMSSSQMQANRASLSHLPSSVHLVEWVSSQYGVLSHPRTALFLSHCGINSAYESLLYETPLLCLPMFFDQNDMAIRVVDAGVGARLDKFTFTVDDVVSSVRNLLRNDAVDAAVQSISSSIRLAGGVRHAASIVEHVARFNGVNRQVSQATQTETEKWQTMDMTEDYPQTAQQVTMDVAVVVVTTVITLILINVLGATIIFKCIKTRLFRKTKTKTT